MSGLRFDDLLASAVVAILLAGSPCALAQETATTPAQVPAGSSGEAAGGVLPTAPNTPASVAEQVRVPDPLASLDPADRAIAERIRDLLAMKPNRFFADEKEYAAVEAFYQKRNLAPLWLDRGVELSLIHI